MRQPLIALLCLSWLPLAQAEESAQEIAADESTPAQEVVNDLGRFEFAQKATIQGGYGPENGTLGNDRKSFYGLRYEPTLAWYSEEGAWSRWQGFGRAWLNYNSGQASTPLQENDVQQIEYFSAELREFYLRRNLLGDDPRFALSFGRQRFGDYFGLWWDDSIESVRLHYDDSFARGFVAIAEQFHSYNSDINDLDDDQQDIAYLMAEYALRWQAQQWAGARLMVERDHSGDDETDDPQDFDGVRAGLFFTGEQLDWYWLSDYRLELALLDGESDFNDGSSQDRRGWAVLAELGKRFDERPWQPRLYLHGGLTDKPDESDDGFYLNAIQSDRVADPQTYSTGLVSAFVGIDLNNLAFYGIGLQSHPQPRHRLDLRLTDLRLRDPDLNLPLRVADDEGRDGSHGLGQTLDLNYYWEMFPLAVDQRQMQINALFSLSYFRAGSAVRGLDDDYQASFGLVLRY
jgi:alginate production protein